MSDDVCQVLVISVGGSADPVISSIQQMRPDEIVFVVSDGSESTTSSQDSLKEILARIDVDAPRNQIQVPPDNLDQVFSKLDAEIARRVAHGSHVVVDYTGGTKTMTSGMVLAAAGHKNTRLQFMAGTRRDLKQVEPGSETPREMPLALFGVAQVLASATTFIEKRNYSAALGILRELQKDIQKMRKSSIKPPKSWTTKLESRTKWLAILDSWDRFDHKTALQKLQAGLDLECDYAVALEEDGVFERLNELANQTLASPELLEDLWLNAKRRADLGLYDDAMGRLYRLSEATVQACLARIGINTSDVPYDRLAPKLYEKHYNPKFPSAKLHLTEALEQLRHSDPQCKLLKVWPDKLPEWQGQRNNSILAHGFKPLDQQQYQSAERWFVRILVPVWRDLLGRDLLPQLPDTAPI